VTSATPSPDVLLAVERLEVAYHRVVTAVQGVSLIVPRGKVVALLGTNGAGKTTTLRAISGFLGIDDARVTEGRILYKGQRIENRAPHHVTGLGIVLVPERSKVFENLSVDENLEATVPGHVPGFDRRRMAEAVFEYFPALARVRAREAGLLSGGERQMLAIGAALMCGPELLLVDELSLGLAPVVVEELMTRLQTIRRTLGMTILLVEQNANFALGVSQRGYVLETGKVVLSNESAALKEDPEVQKAYLGG